LDLDSNEELGRIIESLPYRERVLLEAGTPLIKKFGVGIVEKIREFRMDAFIVADLKTMDVGRMEVKGAADATADAVCILGVASNEVVEKSVQEAQKQGIYSVLDMMNVSDVVAKLNSLRIKPDVVLLHRSVDVESLAREMGRSTEVKWGDISQVKGLVRLVAVAGGLTPEASKEALKQGADILIVGRYIIKSKEPRRAAEDFLQYMPPDADTMRLILDEDEILGEGNSQ
jgi:bifunctional enzyme Fae/Hps